MMKIYGLYDEETDSVLGWYDKQELFELMKAYKPTYNRDNMNCLVSLLRYHRIDYIKYRGKKYRVYVMEDVTKEELMEGRSAKV